MPNYSKREQDLLSAEQQKLSADSRQPHLGGLGDAALLALIDEIDKALEAAGPAGQDGDKTAADMLKAALNRAGAERRKRGLKPDGSPRAGTQAAAKAARPAAGKAGVGNRGKRRRAASSAGRQPAGRKTDLRTGSRRVAKATPPPLVEAETPTGNTPAMARDPAAKEARKAEKKAAKEAEKAARKADRKAAKEAEKAARKAEKKAAREAEKAARKAEKAAARAGDRKSGGKKKKSAGD